ncbi:MAG: flagellin [Alphaproteobacteria bacterium]
MPSTISTLGVQLFTSYYLQRQQADLATLTEQLASQKQHNNLTDYAPVNAHNILDFQNGITQRQAYIAGIQTVNARLTVYDSTMNDMENIAAQAKSLIVQNQTLDTTKIPQLRAQAQTYLRQLQDDLNQEVGGRYIYAGTRYSTVPVIDLTTLAAPTIPFVPETTPNLPDYDMDYVAPGPTTSAAAWAKESVAVDNAFTVQYGVTSTETGFQQLIAGLRVFHNATNLTDPAAYQTAMVDASNLITEAVQNIQATHAAVAGNINILKQQNDIANTDIVNLQNQLSSIQQVDLTSVGTQINLLQVQLQASYSATAGIIQQSILKYL